MPPCGLRAVALTLVSLGALLFYPRLRDLSVTGQSTFGPSDDSRSFV